MPHFGKPLDVRRNAYSFNMKQFQLILLLTLLVFNVSCFGQPYHREPSPPDLSKAECLSMLKRVSPNWLKDTVNKNERRNGFRRKFGWEYYERLDSLAGMDWQGVYIYLGLPDRVNIDGQSFKPRPEHMAFCGRVGYFYHLGGWEVMSLNSGDILMTIIVVEGKIKDVHWQWIDG